jgi:ATP-binding protein involved in chromosome partitioning
MSVTQEAVLEALRSVIHPGLARDIVTIGAVKELVVDGDEVRFHLELSGGNPAVAERLREVSRTTVEGLSGVRCVRVDVQAVSAPSSGLGMAGSAQPHPSAPEGPAPLPGIAHTIAVASGKGGVGKSTVAVNLAVALAKGGLRTALLDADIYGPSIPLMMGVNEQPEVDPNGPRIIPFERHGIRFMSLGFLVDPREAVIWRGPMVMKALGHLLDEVAWGELDVMVVDLPPGTGDAQLTLAQKVLLSGAIIVTTPQDVALADAIKGVAMFRKVGVPVMGIVENMSYFACPHCGERTDIFGHGGGKAEAERMGVPFLGEVALDPAIRNSGDKGTPAAITDPDAPRAKTFSEIAARVRASLRFDAPHGRASRTADS